MDFISWDKMFGLFQSGRRGFGEFYHKRHGKTRMDQNQIKAQNQKGFLFRRN